jgi:hypothetical protein
MQETGKVASGVRLGYLLEPELKLWLEVFPMAHVSLRVDNCNYIRVEKD